MEKESITIRVLGEFHHDGHLVQVGDKLEMHRVKALGRIEGGLAEPIIEILEYVPVIAGTSAPIKTALYRYTMENPQLVPLVDSGDNPDNQERSDGLNFIKLDFQWCDQKTSWTRIWAETPKLERTGPITPPSRANSWSYVPSNRRSRYVEQGRHISSEERFRRAKQEFIYQEGIRRFVRHLRSGQLMASGVLANDYARNETRKIPAAFWKRNLIVFVDAGTVHECDVQSDKPGEPIWAAITVSTDGKGSSRSPRREGRPSKTDWVIPAFQEMVHSGRPIAETKIGAAQDLIDSRRVGAPDEQLPAAVTVAKQISHEYDRLLSKR